MLDERLDGTVQTLDPGAAEVDPGAAEDAAGSVARTLQRWLIGTVVLVAPVIVMPLSTDIYAVPKATLVWLAALGCLALEWGWGRRYPSRRLPPAVAGSCLVLLAALLFAVPRATHLAKALYGHPTRLAGVLTYAAAMVLCATVARAVQQRHVRGLLLLHGVAGVVVAATVLFETLRQRHLFGVRQAFSQPGGTMGNADFAAGYLAISAVAMLGLVVAVPRRRARVLLLIGLLAQLAALRATGALQGPVALAVGLVAMVAVGAAALPERFRRLVRAALVVGVLMAMVLVVMGVSSRGPLRTLAGDAGTGARVIYWRVAGELLREHPVRGLGAGRFEEKFEQALRPQDASTLGNEETVDHPHNVPLGLAVDAGLVAGAAYLMLVALVARAAMRGSRQSSGPRLALLAAATGSWAAYQAQAMVSIDEPPFSALHWILAGLVLVLARPESSLAAIRGRPRARSRQALAVGTVATLLAAGLVSWPLWSERALTRVVYAVWEGDTESARAAADRALDMGYDSSRQWSMLLQLAMSVGDWESALVAAEWAMAREPWLSRHPYWAGMAAQEQGDDERAARLYLRAVSLAPVRPAMRDAALQAGERLHDPAIARRVTAIQARHAGRSP